MAARSARPFWQTRLRETAIRASRSSVRPCSRQAATELRQREIVSPSSSSAPRRATGPILERFHADGKHAGSDGRWLAKKGQGALPPEPPTKGTAFGTPFV